jgi:HK97 gp10 family phage protein
MALDDTGTGRSIAANVTERWDSRLNKQSGGDDLGFRIGVAHGAKIPKGNPDEGKGGPTPHWRLLEFGTEKMQAKPFLRPVIEQAGQQAVDTFVTEYDKAIDRALKRAQKSGSK